MITNLDKANIVSDEDQQEQNQFKVVKTRHQLLCSLPWYNEMMRILRESLGISGYATFDKDLVTVKFCKYGVSLDISF